jgi:hypothetical protein
MGTNPYQGQNPDQSNQYGGYTGYTPPAQNDPHSSQQHGDTSGGQEDYQYGQYTYGQGQQQQQQYGAYQPPQSTLRGSTGTSGADDATSLGMNGKTAAAASYVLFFLSGIVFFLLERKNRFVRFCAAQSTLLFVGNIHCLRHLALSHGHPLTGFSLESDYWVRNGDTICRISAALGFLDRPGLSRSEGQTAILRRLC